MEGVSAMKRSAIDQIETVRNSLATLLIIAFIGALLTFSFHLIPDQNKDILTYMVGQLSGMATTALGFYFINKVGSDALDATRSENTGKLADLAKTAISNASGGGEGDVIRPGDDVTINKTENPDG